jgi:ammonium transporter Rh
LGGLAEQNNNLQVCIVSFHQSGSEAVYMKLYICYLLSVNLQPFLLRNLKVHDTCGVHNLHGMPGVLAGIVGALMAGIASESQYGPSLYQQFPARAPTGNNSHIYDSSGLTFFIPGDGRSAGEQAGYQLLAVGVTLLIAIAGGLITGM